MVPRGGAARQLCSAAGDLLGAMEQPSAWDRFYAQREHAGAVGHFEWFFGYEAVAGLLLPLLQGPGAARVLDVGCGTSALGLGLYRDCPHPVHVCCLDAAPAALAALQRLLRMAPPPRHPRSHVRLCLGDATDLARGGFAPASLRLILDKGTCDALLRCPAGPGRAGRLVAECLRALQPGGRLLQFSDEDPDARVPFLERVGMAGVSVQELGVPGGVPYYVYTVEKPVGG
ncbi:citrate synthase-lysine N-methyltransferase CSKMT, mitochondrial [Apteryx rowi]|uniref:citrate synthase-lysine N-methyltransferase CSKMT, mitochondrial n=1 Tax=Apteryx rowi TaxID=308060 RepID=UPI000E1D4336|nr:citrate synthase-lysine N-methyltransferase CSKMT, mitochondrial [Apteryx rowi]